MNREGVFLCTTVSKTVERKGGSSMNDKSKNDKIITDTIQIHLGKDSEDDLLMKLHTHFTELAPIEYYGKNVIEVENHSTQKRYSIRGEENLSVHKQKRLVYLIEDGSRITIDSNEESNTFICTLEVRGTELPIVLQKSSAIHKTLFTIIQSIQ